MFKAAESLRLCAVLRYFHFFVFCESWNEALNLRIIVLISLNVWGIKHWRAEGYCTLLMLNGGMWEGNLLCNTVLGVNEFPRRTLGATVLPYHESSLWWDSEQGNVLLPSVLGSRVVDAKKFLLIPENSSVQFCSASTPHTLWSLEATADCLYLTLPVCTAEPLPHEAQVHKYQWIVQSVPQGVLKTSTRDSLVRWFTAMAEMKGKEKWVSFSAVQSIGVGKMFLLLNLEVH